MVDLTELDFKPKPIDRDFLSKTDEYPVNGEHIGHDVRAWDYKDFTTKASHTRQNWEFAELQWR